MSSIETLLLFLSLIEGSISFLWFYNGIKYPNESKIIDESTKDCNLGCKIIGTIQIFFSIFDWLLVSFTISHLKNMIINPINFILNSNKKIQKYLIISGISALIISILCYIFEIVGKSPINTCFLSLDFYFEKSEEKILGIKKEIILFFAMFICLIPCFNLLCDILQIIIVFKNPSYKSDKENKKIFNEYYIYLLFYIIITLFLSTLYIVQAFNYYIIKDINLSYKIYFYIISLLQCLTPLIVGIIRLFKITIIKKFFKSIKNCCNKNQTSDKNTSLINSTNENDKTFINFETSVVKKFVMNIYITVCYCLSNKQTYTNNENDENFEELAKESCSYKISKETIKNNFPNSQLSNDLLLNNREEFSISCIEYAPKIFNELRKLDSIDENILINSILPMNNKNGLAKKTEGRGGSFFINTDDNEFSIKTITFNEMELVRNLLLEKMFKYFNENNDSIIGRIYGLYKISISNGIFKEEEIYFILMKNVIGSFKDNLLCKYDLKGSILNRKVKYENVDSNVMKDINFNEIEQVFLLNKKNCDLLKNIAAKDANFFCECGIMDYSLLVAKISLNNNEINELFGKNHRKEAEKEFFDLAGLKTEKSLDESAIININLNRKKDENNINEINKDLRFDLEKIKPLKKYMFPSLKGDVVYLIAIIDFFQVYNLQKNFETKYKKFMARVKTNYISSVPPKVYKERFIEFVDKKTDTENYIKDITSKENKNDF